MIMSESRYMLRIHYNDYVLHQLNVSHALCMTCLVPPPPSTQALDRREMLRVPFSLSWQAQSRSVAMWLCISKYPLRTLFHLLTMYTGEVYLQVWACACSGDVIIRWGEWVSKLAGEGGFDNQLQMGVPS